MTVEELFNSKELKSELREIMTKNLKERRKNRDVGVRYKRDWYDRIKDNFNVDFFLLEYQLIHSKTSKLSKEQRDVILFFVSTAINNVLKQLQP